MAKALKITAKRNGFRRAGMSHPDTAVTHPLSALTVEQIEQLESEPMLVVQDVEIEDEEADRYGADGQHVDLDGMDEGAVIAVVEKATDLSSLSLLRDGEERPAVVEAIAARGADIAGRMTLPTKKAELQAWCRAHGVEYTDEHTVADLTAAAQAHLDSFTRGPE